MARKGQASKMAATGDDAGARRHYLASMHTATTANAASPSRSTPADRFLALIYDPFLWLGERRALQARRGELLKQARGLTVEIGSGTGLNLAHYPSGLDQLVLAEPDPAMRRRLQRRAGRVVPQASVIDASAEQLPFADETVDTVVSTLVLCTVEAPELALQEIARVLAPGGQLLFIEHVRASTPARSFWQDALAGPWAAFAGGCRCNRPTVATIAECGFELDVSEAPWRGMPGIVRPLACGRARPFRAAGAV
ncbi:MAG TPA: class I SAM-dependent methyltransferase [Solirubrobacteraceae bacterium]|nr:class I SAM-dependent methyltransferase [Solirubrobacteraceae bacterium]